VASLLFLAILILLPALFTWVLVRLLVAYGQGGSRRQVLAKAVPAGALLPLLPGTIWVAMEDMINNAALIAVAGTLMLAVVIGVCVCLPVGLAATRDL
jgi:hypothetical protein